MGFSVSSYCIGRSVWFGWFAPAGAQHATRSGKLHGGAMLARLDHANALAARLRTKPGRKRHAAILNLETRFIGRGRLGNQLIA